MDRGRATGPKPRSVAPPNPRRATAPPSSSCVASQSSPTLPNWPDTPLREWHEGEDPGRVGTPPPSNPNRPSRTRPAKGPWDSTPTSTNRHLGGRPITPPVHPSEAMRPPLPGSSRTAAFEAASSLPPIVNPICHHIHGGQPPALSLTSTGRSGWQEGPLWPPRRQRLGPFRRCSR